LPSKQSGKIGSLRFVRKRTPFGPAMGTAEIGSRVSSAKTAGRSGMRCAVFAEKPPPKKRFGLGIAACPPESRAFRLPGGSVPN
jgi:hypothetical protein